MPNVIRIDLVPESIQPDAQAAVNAVGVRVHVPDDLPADVILGSTMRDISGVGVVVGCRASAFDGQDVWTVRTARGWVDVICGWVQVLEA